ncbi:zinc finger protein 501-like isoform X2 [Toxorhynchites rutilus septentrionalis]|uniref:zinc finger protein 501-like isoform X2 n=1 Tax=Toxorhynchites rutilus septentrionalis TaxID=329112 RepID=UPI00247AA1F2|nr:zinc finger protein 501-like isoform X2 [Toxorhynchites rutilus septentrionalis]
MAIVSNNFDQCSFCSVMCDEEFHHVLVPSLLQEQKLKPIHQKLSGVTSQLSSYPTCDKCRQEFIITHNISENCFQILPSTKPNDIKTEPELMIDDHELSNTDNIFERDTRSDFAPLAQEAEVQIKGEKGEVFFISEIDGEGNNIPLIPVARTNMRRKNNLNASRSYSCSHCEKAFKDSSSLQRHIRIHTGERPFSCPHCPKAFTQHIALKQHIRIHTGERPFSCPHCPKAFMQHTTLKLHVRIHTDERPYSCPHCPKAFKHQPTLKQHIGTHTDERPYSCPHCPEVFKNPSALLKHIRIHTEKRPYSCSHCPKAFKNPSALQKHNRSHTGERPYSCSHCPKAFKEASTLKEHIRTHTDERPYSCPYCFKAFRQSTVLGKHLHTHCNETGGSGMESLTTAREDMTGC